MGSIAETTTTNAPHTATIAKTTPSHLIPHLTHLQAILTPSEIITPSSDLYTSNTQAWSVAKDQHPALCLRPSNTTSLSKIIAYLSSTNLDFIVRSGGYGSASAKDVIISLQAFDDFEFNEKEKTVILGAGAAWRKYYNEMAKVAPTWTIVAARTPSIGVGGSTLASGFSWLSSEYGCVSDEGNMLDAEVVLADGTVTWLKGTKYENLLWALRGTQGGFAAVTRFKFRAFEYEQQGKIWCGPILIPREKVEEVARGIMGLEKAWNRGEVDAKVAMFLYVMRKELLAFLGADQDMLVVHAYDAMGEERGRKLFAWALEIEGAVDQTKGGMTLRDVAMLQDHIGDLRGTASNYWQPLALKTLSEDIIINAFNWWSSMLKETTSVRDQGYLLFELFSCTDSLAGRHSSAWPRPVGYKQMVLLGSGCAPDAPAEDLETAKRYCTEAPMKILGKPIEEIDVVPNAIEDFHDVMRIYGEHYEKLREIKRKYDPKDMFKGFFKP